MKDYKLISKRDITNSIQKIDVLNQYDWEGREEIHIREQKTIQ